MPERSSAPSARPAPGDQTGDAPPAEVVEFIRFCHRRRRVGWPELYDEMCAVAARREFNGWDHRQLAAHGVTFTLYEMPRLAGWVRQVVGRPAETRETRETPAAQVAAQPVSG